MIHKRLVITMKKISLLLILITGWCLLFSPTLYGQQLSEQKKIAQTGMKFLSLSLDARAAGMSDAVTSLEGFSSSMFYNPAGMARQNTLTNVSGGIVQWIADIEYIYGSLAISPFNGRYGVIGLTFLSVDYGEFQETIRFDNDQGFIDLGTFSPTAFAIGLGYANALTERFSVGGNVKYVRQDLGESAMNLGTGDTPEKEAFDIDVVAFDFGVLYKTGFRSLNFAMSVRNFSEELRYVRENFQLPLTFRIGLSMDMLDIMENRSDIHKLLLAVDAERPRDFYEQLKVGAEYVFMNTLAIRGGYIFPSDEQGVNLGMGVQQSLVGTYFSFDYSYSDMGVFSGVHRFAFQFSF
jgi:hypothetical protein